MPSATVERGFVVRTASVILAARLMGLCTPPMKRTPTTDAGSACRRKTGMGFQITRTRAARQSAKWTAPRARLAFVRLVRVSRSATSTGRSTSRAQVDAAIVFRRRIQLNGARFLTGQRATPTL